MGLLAGADLINIAPPNLSPSWTSTPVVSFIAGVGGTKNLSDHTFDPESDSLTYTLNGSSAAWPTGMSMNSSGVVTGTSSVVEGTTTGMLVDIDDGVNPVVTSPSFSVVIVVTITDQALRDLGYILLNDYAGVDPTGVNDSTSGIQDAFLDISSKAGASTKNRPLWIAPDSVYKISDTLRANSYSQGDSICIVGGSNGATPKFVLVDSTAAFNTGTERPIFVCRAHHSATWPNFPSDPLSNSAPFNTIVGNHFGITLINIEIDCGINADAFGFYFPMAQRSFAANLKVDCTNAKGGFHGLLGRNSPMMNIEVVGGVWQIKNEIINNEASAGSCIAGLKLTGDSNTVDAIINEDFVPLVIVGFDITFTKATSMWTVDAGSFNTSGSGHVVFIDGIFRMTGAANPMIDNSNPRSSGGSKSMYLRNVYVTGTDNLIQSGAESVVTATGTWKLINEYAYTEQGSRDAAKGWYEHYSIIDGSITRTPEPATDIDSSVSAPVVDYIARHIITIPLVDSGPFVNVEDEGAVGTELEFGQELFRNNYSPPLDEQASDSEPAFTDAIAAAKAAGHNTVVIPRKAYAFKSKVTTDKDTIMIGVHPFKSRIFPHADWRPTSNVFMMETPDEVTGTGHMSMFGFIMREIDGSFTSPAGPYQFGWFSWVNWRIGRNSTAIWQARSREFVNSSFDTQNGRFYYHFEGGAGGKHYALGEHKGRNWGATGNRQIRISGTSEPMHLYGVAVESTKQGAEDVRYNIEILNSSNIRLYSSKREGDSPTCRYFNSSNIAFYGSGRQQLGTGHPINGVHVIDGTSDDILIAPITKDELNLNTDTGKSMLYEDIGFGVIRVDWPQGVSLYKRGTIDDAAATI